MVVFRETITQKGEINYLLGSAKYKNSFLAKYSSFCRQKSVEIHGVQVHPFGKRRVTKAFGWAKVNHKLGNFK